MNESKETTLVEFPLMKFVDKTERTATVTIVDSNHMFWILFIHDSINVHKYNFVCKQVY